MSDAAKIRRLERHITHLLEQLDIKSEEFQVFKDKFKQADWDPSLELGLTPSEAEICRILLARQHTTKEQIFAHLYSDKPEPESWKIIDVFICKIRKKLDPLGIGIQTFYGGGYALSPNAKLELRSKSFETWQRTPNNQKESPRGCTT